VNANFHRLIVADVIEWADRFRHVAVENSANPGPWHTDAQPCCYGPMSAVTERDTHTITVMAGTQIIKTEFLINVAGYYIHAERATILFVQPTQGAAANFSKERFQTTVNCTPVLRDLIEQTSYRDSANTITHKEYPGGFLDFVGANSEIDVISRPKRIILCDEIDSYPPSAGTAGDPLKLAEERASTYKSVGRAKFVRTCSPTNEGTSRIAREYEASDQRKLFVPCPHCSHQQTLRWENLHWARDEQGGPLFDTAALTCEACGVVWSERDRVAALDALKDEPGYGWRQTKPFVCCGEEQMPTMWTDAGRSLCIHCHQNSLYDGHAGFHINKLYSKRHRLPELVREFFASRGNREMMKTFTNNVLAETFKPQLVKTSTPEQLHARCEAYSPDDLPQDIQCITAWCDTQLSPPRLEVQVVGWGYQEEAWAIDYIFVNQDPAGTEAWQQLDELIMKTRYKVRGTDRVMHISAFGIDMGGAHTAQVLAHVSKHRGLKYFATKGFAGPKSIWSNRPMESRVGGERELVYPIGVDTAKDLLFSRLAFAPPEAGFRKAGYMHFPAADVFNLEYFRQLVASEVRERRWRAGQPYDVFKQIRDRNEALDTWVGNLAMRRSLHQQYVSKGGSTAPPLPASPVVETVSSSEDNMSRSTTAPPAEKMSPEWYDDEIAKLLTKFPELRTDEVEKLLKEIAAEDDDDEEEK
jgi:phage terminase large subunit GpA-like protein